MAFRLRDRSGLLPQCSVVLLDPRHQTLELSAQRDPLGPKDELVQVLSMPGIDRESGMDVFVDENVVKDHQLRPRTIRAIPSAILEHRSR